MNEEAGVRPTIQYLLHDPIERNLPVAEVAEAETEDEEGGRHAARHRDLTSRRSERVSRSRATSTGPYPEPMLAPCGRIT